MRDFTQNLKVGRCENEAVVSCGGCDVIVLVVIVFPTPAAKNMNVREFRLIVLHLKVSGIILSCARKPSKFNGIYGEFEHGFPKPEKR